MNFHARMMNIEFGVFGTPSLEYRQGHKCARHAAAGIANEADARIAELEAQLAAAQADIKILQANVSYQMERNRNNVANAQLQINELTSEYQTWREACGKARERADAAADEITRLRDEMQAMVGRLTALAEEFQTEETWDGKRNDALRYCAGRLREAIGGEGEK